MGKFSMLRLIEVFAKVQSSVFGNTGPPSTSSLGPRAVPESTHFRTAWTGRRSAGKAAAVPPCHVDKRLLGAGLFRGGLGD